MFGHGAMSQRPRRRGEHGHEHRGDAQQQERGQRADPEGDQEPRRQSARCAVVRRYARGDGARLPRHGGVRPPEHPRRTIGRAGARSRPLRPAARLGYDLSGAIQGGAARQGDREELVGQPGMPGSGRLEATSRRVQRRATTIRRRPAPRQTRPSGCRVRAPTTSKPSTSPSATPTSGSHARRRAVAAGSASATARSSAVSRASRTASAIARKLGARARRRRRPRSTPPRPPTIVTERTQRHAATVVQRPLRQPRVRRGEELPGPLRRQTRSEKHREPMRALAGVRRRQRTGSPKTHRESHACLLQDEPVAVEHRDPIPTMRRRPSPCARDALTAWIALAT